MIVELKSAPETIMPVTATNDLTNITSPLVASLYNHTQNFNWNELMFMVTLIVMAYTLTSGKKSLTINNLTHEMKQQDYF